MLLSSFIHLFDTQLSILNITYFQTSHFPILQVYKELPQTLQDGETFGKDLSWKAILTLLPGSKPKHVIRSAAVAEKAANVPELYSVPKVTTAELPVSER